MNSTLPSVNTSTSIYYSLCLYIISHLGTCFTFELTCLATVPIKSANIILKQCRDLSGWIQIAFHPVIVSQITLFNAISLSRLSRLKISNVPLQNLYLGSAEELICTIYIWKIGLVPFL